MSEEDKLDLIEKFIYNNEVQNILSEINDNVMDFNILEITGMGSQEIKHSNILGWLFDNSEHDLEYQMLDGFLKKVIAENPNKNLQEYLYLSNKKRDISIYREKDNIDLLIVDESNKIVITIENKVYANERADGEDGGQLQKYEDIINKKYNNNYAKYFIFLTVDLERPSKENWLRASHQMITGVIENILETKETTTKTKIVLESYVDLLKRNGIVEDKKLEEVCKKIWANDKYKNALDILNKHKTSRVKIFYDEVLKKELDFFGDTVWIDKDGSRDLYKIIELDWKDKSLIACQYFNDFIEIYFAYKDVCESGNDIIHKVCEDVIGKRRSKEFKTIKKYTINDLNRGENIILKEIQNEIDNIDEKLQKAIQKYTDS